jgi:ATP-dependent DNA ligase
MTTMHVKAQKRTKAFQGLRIPLDLEPMEARSVAELPEDTGWQFEPKWDGFRCLALRAENNVEMTAKSGKSLSRFFPEVLDNLRAVPEQHFVLDCELVIDIRGRPSFDALQMRLHPAETRIHKLAAETPARLIAFDCLQRGLNTSLLDKPFEQRRLALERLLAKPSSGIALTDYTRDRRRAARWLEHPETAYDGVVAKRLDVPYRYGERAMLKVKRKRTADCVVGGFRYASAGNIVGSLLLGLYNDTGLLHHVGFTSNLSAMDKLALTTRLEALIESPGFTGDAPGGPSRWSTQRSAQWQPLRPVLVVEVSFDHVTGDRFRHGTAFVRWRPDKSPRQCTFDQLRGNAPKRPRSQRAVRSQ